MASASGEAGRDARAPQPASAGVLRAQIARTSSFICLTLTPYRAGIRYHTSVSIPLSLCVFKSPLQLRHYEASGLVLQPTAAGNPQPGQKNPRKARLGAQKTTECPALLPKRSMQALATPRQPPQSDRAATLSLRSRAGRVTPLPDLDFVELGRQGLLSGSITSPRVSRRQATLLRLPDGALRVVSQGANPTAVVTCVEINQCVGCR